MIPAAVSVVSLTLLTLCEKDVRLLKRSSCEARAMSSSYRESRAVAPAAIPETSRSRRVRKVLSWRELSGDCPSAAWEASASSTAAMPKGRTKELLDWRKAASACAPPVPRSTTTGGPHLTFWHYPCLTEAR